MNTIKMYYQLVKPGIVYSNAIATMAGFFLAYAQLGRFDIGIFLGVVIGTSFIIASACVLNNYIDRHIDKKMKRTSKRATAAGRISRTNVLAYTVTLGLIGLTILGLLTNMLTMVLGVLAYISYIVLYGIGKRRTVHGTLVGAISGGLPPVAGYAALANRLDMAAILLFFVLVAWQMPHFYAIAMRRKDEYAAANIPVLPVVKGLYATKVQIVLYVVLFIAVNILFTAFGYTGYVYLVVMTIVGFIWLYKGLKGFKTEADEKWALKMFLFSLVVLLILCVMLAVGGLLP